MDLRDKAAQKQLPIPFIFKYFNVKPFYTNKGFRTGINILLDPLAEALNTIHKLPKYILVIPDKDLLAHLRWGNSGISIEIGAALHYLIKQHDIYIDRCRRLLSQKKPGALIEDGYPKLIWVRMLKRSQNIVDGKIFNFRGRFNSILEERLLDGNSDQHHIMSIDIQHDDFDVGGSLTTQGKATFWREVNRAVEKFDSDSITLRPRKYKPSQQAKPIVQKPTESCKFPTPPPTKRKHSSGESRHGPKYNKRHRSRSPRRTYHSTSRERSLTKSRSRRSSRSHSHSRRHGYHDKHHHHSHRRH